jgi:hypothetical protein
MAEDKTKTPPRDASRVNVDDDGEREYWTARFGVSERRLRDAVGTVGVIVDDVERELKGTASAGHSAG